MVIKYEEESSKTPNTKRHQNNQEQQDFSPPPVHKKNKQVGHHKHKHWQSREAQLGTGTVIPTIKLSAPQLLVQIRILLDPNPHPTLSTGTSLLFEVAFWNLSHLLTIMRYIFFDKGYNSERLLPELCTFFDFSDSWEVEFMDWALVRALGSVVGYCFSNMFISRLRCQKNLVSRTLAAFLVCTCM